MFEHACRLGLEGIISKRADLPYRSGRGEHWLKAKAVLRQEFVILGYMPSTAAKGPVGALLLGYYDGGDASLCRPRRHRLFRPTRRDRSRDTLDKIAAAKPQARQRAARRRRERRALGRSRDSSARSSIAAGPRTD